MSMSWNFRFFLLILVISLSSKFIAANKCEFKNTKYWVNTFYSCNIQPNSNKPEKHLAGKTDNDVKAVEFNGKKLRTPNFSQAQTSFFGRFNNLNAISIKGVKSVDGNILQNFGDLLVFELEKTEVRELPANFFSGNSKLQEIIIVDSKLTTLPENIFSNLKELKYLRVEKSDISSFPANIFKPLKKLKILSLEDNKIRTLNPAWFESLGHLEKLIIGQNKLSDLPKNIFKSLTNLDFLAVEKNQLTTVHSDSFGSIKKITFMTFDNNKIASVDRRILDIFPLNWFGMENNVCIKDFIYTPTTGKAELKPCLDAYQPRR